MLAILYYCLKVIVCSGILYGYYLLALRNNRFHQWNRWYLLGCVVLSFGLPLLQIPLPAFFQGQPQLVYGAEVMAAPGLYLAQHNTGFHFSLPLVALLVYIAIALFRLLHLLKNVWAIRHLKQAYQEENIDGIRFYSTTEPGTPFSFFNNIFWNSSISLHSTKGQQMLRHEITHVQEQHSADAILVQVLLAVAFWNPFLYRIKKELSVVHEFIADQKALAGDDQLQYASLLLMKAMGSPQLALGHSFFHSPLKRRLIMLTTNKNPRLSYARRVVALPLASILMAAFSFQCQRPAEERQALAKQEETKQVNIPLPENTLYLINNEEATKEAVNALNPNTIASMNVLKGEEAINEFGEKGKNGVIQITLNPGSKKISVVGVQIDPASFPGGLDGWRRYLERNLKYPEKAQENGIQGVVRVELTVQANGTVADVKPLNDPGAGLAAEAVRIIEKGPKWVPATQNGKNVDYRFVQNITYQLQ